MGVKSLILHRMHVRVTLVTLIYIRNHINYIYIGGLFFVLCYRGVRFSPHIIFNVTRFRPPFSYLHKPFRVTHQRYTT